MSIANVFPGVFKNAEGEFVAQMKDPNGRVWAESVAKTAQEAIASARTKLPKKGTIRSILGWSVNHPMLTSLIIATGRWAMDSGFRSKTVGAWLFFLIETYLAVRSGKWVAGKFGLLPKGD